MYTFTGIRSQVQRPLPIFGFFLSFVSRYSALAFIDLFILVQSWEEKKQEWNKLPFCYFASVFVLFLGSVGLLAASRDYVCYIVYHSLIHPFLSSHQPMTIYQASTKFFGCCPNLKKMIQHGIFSFQIVQQKTSTDFWHLFFSQRLMQRKIHFLLVL